ncbi:unnamed protein product [Oreochromis niloticus]|nr:unnamed protein product [Mustela putorius furo]
MRKRGRKGGRLEPDFSGPYTIDDISGKCVRLKNAEGNTLKSLYSIDHIKPYRTSHPVQVSTPTEPVESSPSSEMQPCSPQHHHEALQNNRPSVIQFAPKIAQVKSVQAPEELVPVTPQKPSTQEKVKWLWAAKDTGRVETVVGPYKLYDSSFRTLEDSGWLSDEVIDAYLHCLIRKQKEPVYQLSCVVATSLFSGKFKCVSKMLFPAEDIWLCPLNFSAHWILVVVKISSRSVLLLDPLGNEGCYERKIMRNWRNFLKMKGKEESRVDWKMETLPHSKQMDSSSCRVLVLKFAEHYLMSGEVTRVLSNPEAIGLQRTEIACELLEHQSNADDYCVVCSMLEADPESSMIEMVQCEFCLRWAHFGCAQYESSLVKYLCNKCA